jgi:hypothetical protein
VTFVIVNFPALVVELVELGRMTQAYIFSLA